MIITTGPVSNKEALEFANELETVVGEVMNGKRKLSKIPVEPIFKLIQFARDTAGKAADAKGSGPTMEAAEAASLFSCELFDSVETLGDIAREHGVRTLTDLMHLQDAILTGGFIDALERESSVMKIVSALPSAERWVPHIAEYNTSDELVRSAKFPTAASNAGEAAVVRLGEATEVI